MVVVFSLISSYHCAIYYGLTQSMRHEISYGGNRFPYYMYPAIQTSSGRKLEIPMTNAFTSAVMQYANIGHKVNISYESV